jgi:glycosyltransferase involved in cell wall biosynthesis
MTPRATFVIPAYNADRWISKTIYSCRTQTIKQIEILIINDGSTDGTKDIIEWHSREDRRVRVIHTENQGRSAARNFGNDQATADLILVLDADDLATRNRVKDTIAAFQMKKPDLLYGSFYMMDSFGGTMQKVLSKPFDPELAKKQKMNFICHSTMAYTKALAQAIRYQEGSYTTLGLDDWKFQWDAHRKGYKISQIRNALCYYRVTESGTMATRDNQEVERVKGEFLATI